MAIKESKTTVWFHRHFHRLSGGHLKHAHYFEHVRCLRGHQPRITFTSVPNSETELPTQLAINDPPAAQTAAQGYLWPANDRFQALQWRPTRGDVLFLAGLDWHYLTRRGLDDLPNPRINLIQGVRHAQPDTELHHNLRHRAVRICVSQEVADAIAATGQVNGPIFTIPNGIDLDPQGPAMRSTGPFAACRRLLSGTVSGFMRQGRRPSTKLINVIGYKRPDLAKPLRQTLCNANLPHRLLLHFCPRPQFLSALADASVVVCLPAAEEGFHLPALEAMALGCIVVTLDCIGNRGFCHHGQNCFVAAPTPEAVAIAAANAVNLPPAARRAMRRHARQTVRRHSLATERKQFLAILKNIHSIW